MKKWIRVTLIVAACVLAVGLLTGGMGLYTFWATADRYTPENPVDRDYACLLYTSVVEQHPWLTMSEFTDLITIAEMTPGPIAINSATFVGIRIAGLGGAVVATFGCILPSLLIVSVLAKIYYKYKGAKGLDTVLSLSLIHI